MHVQVAACQPLKSTRYPLKTRSRPAQNPSWHKGQMRQVAGSVVSRAVTNARFAWLQGLVVGLTPSTTPPDPPLKSRARHGRH